MCRLNLVGLPGLFGIAQLRGRRRVGCCALDRRAFWCADRGHARRSDGRNVRRRRAGPCIVGGGQFGGSTLHQSGLEVRRRVHLGRGPRQRFLIELDHHAAALAAGGMLFEADLVVALERTEGRQACELLEFVSVIIDGRRWHAAARAYSTYARASEVDHSGHATRPRRPPPRRPGPTIPRRHPKFRGGGVSGSVTQGAKKRHAAGALHDRPQHTPNGSTRVARLPLGTLSRGA